MRPQLSRCLVFLSLLCISILFIQKLYKFYAVHNIFLRNTHEYPSNFHSTVLDEPLHLNWMNQVCRATKDLIDAPIISWHLDTSAVEKSLLIYPDASFLYDSLSNCPDVEIYLPANIRNYGYCEDSMAFVKYLKSKAFPHWVYTVNITHNNRNFTYFDLCPTTPTIFFNHYWSNLTSLSNWPKTKRIIMMPNVEMYEMRPKHLWSSDIVLCRTLDCKTRINKWFHQEGNPKKTQVFYTKGVSSNPVALARATKGSLPKKNFSDINFLHYPGHSNQKGTIAILDCWHKRPDLPLLEIITTDSSVNRTFHRLFINNISLKDKQKNVILTSVNMDSITFGYRLAKATFVLCPSYMEGYGHYINQARAAETVIFTNDVAPMNELVNMTSGILIPVEKGYDQSQMLGGSFNQKHGLKNVSGMVARIHGSLLCEAIDHSLKKFSTKNFQKFAQQAKNRYNEDIQYFKKAMNQVRAYIIQSASFIE